MRSKIVYRKLHKDDRKAAIDSYLQSGLSLDEFCKEKQIPKGSLLYILYQIPDTREYYMKQKESIKRGKHCDEDSLNDNADCFDTEIDDDFFEKKRNGRYSEQFKEMVCNALMYEIGHVNATAKKFGVSLDSVYRWMRQKYPERCEFFITTVRRSNNLDLNPELMNSVRIDREAGLSFRSIAAKYRTNLNSLYPRFRKHMISSESYNQGVEDTFSEVEIIVSHLMKGKRRKKNASALEHK